MLGLVMALMVWGGDIQVVDADSFTLGGHFYRLYRVDAPQIGAAARCNREIVRSEDAAVRVREILANARSIEVEPAFDPPDAGIWPHDRARARLARVYVDGEDLAAILIAEGRAVPLDIRWEHDWCSERN